MRAAGDYAQQLVGNMLDRTFGNMARRTRSSSVKITYRSRPFYPQPLPGIKEERLVRERSCGTCAIRYAVFGEHRYCPVCGLLPPLIAALDSLDAERKRLQVLSKVPDDVQGPLRESGALHRTYVDTIENIVGTVEVLADRVFRSVVPEPDASAALKGKGKVFQRLDDLAELFMSHAGINLRQELGPRWKDLLRAWATRHVFTHCDGVVDEKYLAAVPDAGLRVGQRVQIREADAQAALNDAEHCVERSLWHAHKHARGPRHLGHRAIGRPFAPPNEPCGCSRPKLDRVQPELAAQLSRHRHFEHPRRLVAQQLGDERRGEVEAPGDRLGWVAGGDHPCGEPLANRSAGYGVSGHTASL